MRSDKNMKKNIKKSIILLNILFMICSTLLCSCMDKSELSEISAVLGIGIDKIPGDEPIRVTLEIANPKISKDTNTGVAKVNNSVIEVSYGKSIFDAIQNFSKTSSLIIDFSHAKIVILSKALCESGVSEVIDYLTRDRQFRSTNWVLATDKTAKEIFESRISNEATISGGIDNMMAQLERNASILPAHLNSFVIESDSESKLSFAPVINIKKSQDNPKGRIKIESTAIFKNDHLLGILTKEESKSLLWLSDNFKGHVTILPFYSGENNENVTVDVYKKSSKIIPHIIENKVHFEIVCTGYAVIRQIHNIKLTPEMADKIEGNTENILKSQINELIYASQKKYNTDFVGFSKKIYNDYPNKWHLMKKDWYRMFPDIKYDINAKINITNIGIINNSATSDEEEAK